MSLEKALGYLEKAGYREHVIQLGESTATVAMAAEALGVFYSQHALVDFEEKCPILRVNALVRRKWLPSPF